MQTGRIAIKWRFMLSEDDFQYALENTRVLVQPQNRLETFGTSLINYYLITEDMDKINLAHVHEGRIHAERPQLLSPSYFAKLLVEGFGEKGSSFADYISQNSQQFAFLKYGFRLRKDDIRSYEVHEPLEAVADKVREEVRRKNDPLSGIVTGIEDGWEVCLLKFMIDYIQGSAPGNIDDMRKRGLL